MTIHALSKPADGAENEHRGPSGRGDTEAGVCVRSGDLDAERRILIELMSRHLPRRTDGATFDWLYQKNPHGKASVWVVTAPHADEVIGAAAAFPRRMYVDGRETMSWVLGDFFIHGRYRSLGPALALQRACLAEVDSGAAAFCYDFPSSNMMAIYSRLRIKPVGQMVRLAKPLRVNRKIRETVTIPIVNDAISWLGNLWLKIGDARLRAEQMLTISAHEGECGIEFSELSSRIGSRYGVCVQRSAEYLNWRYRNHPSCCYEILTVHLDDVLLAYAVFNQSDEDATLVDLFGVEEPAVINRLIGALIQFLRKRGAVTLSASLIDSHPWIPVFRNLGFKARETCPLVVYERSRVNMVEGLQWFLMQGDRDS